MKGRPLNWFGWSIETIAAVYESNMAAEEAHKGLVNNDYIWSAWRAEQREYLKDRQSVHLNRPRI